MVQICFEIAFSISFVVVGHGGGANQSSKEGSKTKIVKFDFMGFNMHICMHLCHSKKYIFYNFYYYYSY